MFPLHYRIKRRFHFMFYIIIRLYPNRICKLLNDVFYVKPDHGYKQIILHL